MVWEPGSGEVGDFTWPGFDSEVVVTGNVLEALNQFQGFEPGQVKIVEDADAPKRAKRVRLPYNGPPLHELWVTARIGMDRQRSSAELENECAECEAERWELYGVERWDSGVLRGFRTVGLVRFVDWSIGEYGFKTGEVFCNV